MPGKSRSERVDASNTSRLIRGLLSHTDRVSHARLTCCITPFAGHRELLPALGARLPETTPRAESLGARNWKLLPADLRPRLRQDQPILQGLHQARLIQGTVSSFNRNDRR